MIGNVELAGQWDFDYYPPSQGGTSFQGRRTIGLWRYQLTKSGKGVKRGKAEYFVSGIDGDIELLRGMAENACEYLNKA